MTGTSTVVPSLTIAIISGQHAAMLGLQKIFRDSKSLQIVVQPHQRMTSDALLPEKRPDVFILDVETERDTIGSISQIRASAPKSKIVLLSGFEDKERTREAFEYGVDGVILKVQPPEVVLAAIEAVYSHANNHVYTERKGELFVDLRETFKKKAEFETQLPVWFDALTEREREVTTLVGQGLSNKEIASRLSISDSTVRHHLTSIFDKVGVPNRQKLLIHTRHFRSTPG
jgi:DNA-binding NarL/FixJ family response regulator